LNPSDDLKRKIIKGQSIEEIARETGLGETTIRKHAKRMVESGIWENGYRKVSYGFVKVFKKIK